MHKNINAFFIILTIIYANFFCIFFSSDVFASEVESNDKETITIAVFELGQTFFYDEKKDGYSGYLVDYLEELAKYENIKFEYVFGTWEESLERVKTGEIDICPFVNKNVEREKIYEFSKHSFGPDGGFLYTNRDDLFYDDFTNFNDKRIGFINEFEIQNHFKKFASANNFTYIPVFYEDESSMVEALDCGEIDMITAESMQQFKKYKSVSRFQMAEYYFISSKENSKLDKINNALSFQRWYDPDIDLKLYKKYYDLSDSKPIFTREEFNYISESRVLTISVLPNRHVQSNFNEDTGEFIGIEPDIVREIEKLSGLKLKIIPVIKGENLISMVENGYSDMSMGVSLMDEYVNSDKFLYSDEIIITPHTLAMRKNDSFSLNDDIIISIPKIFPAAKFFVEKEYSNWEIIEDYNLNDRLDSIIKYEADCTIINRYELQYLLQMPKYKNLAMYPMDFMNFGGHIIISKNSDNMLVRIINKSIESIKYNSIENIINENVTNIKYYPDFWDSVSEYKEFAIIISILLIGLFLIMYLSYKMQKNKNFELKKYIEKLNNAYDKIKEAEKSASDANIVKTEFLARMSHDMRTPMNAIISISDFGMEESLDEEDVDYFKQIKISSLYLLGLLNDILETQKLESDEIELINTAFDFSLMFDEIKNIIKYRAFRKHIEFSTDFDDRYNSYNIYGDKKRIEQVIINIVSNAIKYTKPFGKVFWKTRIEKDNDSIKITHTVTDNGIGMSENFQNKMFDPFTQENNELSDDEFGTGLGLAIVKNIINLMGGEIKCKSEIGKGTSFIIVLEHKLVERVNINDNCNLDYMCNILDGKRILICEDNVINSKIILKILSKYDIITDLAKNGEIGVKKASENEYDLILMDIRMPIMDGLEAAIEIRKFDSTIPIIALSANAYKEDVQKSLSAGMNAHIAKPIDKDELFSQIANWIL